MERHVLMAEQAFQLRTEPPLHASLAPLSPLRTSPLRLGDSTCTGL